MNFNQQISTPTRKNAKTDRTFCHIGCSTLAKALVSTVYQRFVNRLIKTDCPIVNANQCYQIHCPGVNQSPEVTNDTSKADLVITSVTNDNTSFSHYFIDLSIDISVDQSLNDKFSNNISFTNNDSLRRLSTGELQTDKTSPTTALDHLTCMAKSNNKITSCIANLTDKRKDQCEPECCATCCETQPEESQLVNVSANYSSLITAVLAIWVLANTVLYTSIVVSTSGTFCYLNVISFWALFGIELLAAFIAYLLFTHLPLINFIIAHCFQIYSLSLISQHITSAKHQQQYFHSNIHWSSDQLSGHKAILKIDKGKNKNGSFWKRQTTSTSWPMFSTTLLCLMVAISLGSTPCLAKVKITAIKVPLFVENGTQPSVVLDCPFTYDKNQDINLVVKWFFNDDPEPIYQWIVELGTRIVHQRYEGKINANYTVPTTNDPFQKHRALNLLRPTVELNGRYSCHIISIMSQDAAEATMIVYAKTKSIALSTRRVVKERSTALQQTNRHHLGYGHHQHPRQKPHSGGSSVQQQSQPQSDSSQSPWHSNSAGAAAASLSSSWLYSNTDQQELPDGSSSSSSSSPSVGFKSPSTTEIECSVQNVFPLPELTIYQMDGQRPKSLENPRYAQNVTKLPNGAFSVSVKAFIEDTELFPQTTAAAVTGATGANSGSSTSVVGRSGAFSASGSRDTGEGAALVVGSGGGGFSQHQSQSPSAVFECLVSQEELRHELRKRTQYTLIDESDYDSSATGHLLISSFQQMIFLIFTLLSLTISSSLILL